MFMRRFHRGLRKNNDHTCLFHCIPSDDVCTLGLTASCSNSILGTRQMLIHEKNMRDPYIVRQYAVFLKTDENRMLNGQKTHMKRWLLRSKQ